MSLKTKLLLLVTISITASVGAVAGLIEERAHEAFRQVEQERTSALVNQFRREFEHAGDEITRGVDTIASSDAMQRAVTELANGAEYATYVNEAASNAAAQRLDFLDLIAPDGAIISSAHWPARFGYKERWFLDLSSPLPRQAFLKHIETPQGSVLSMLCFRTVPVHGLNYYLIGGRKLDTVVQSLSPPEGLRVAIFSVPEQGSGELIGPGKENLYFTKLTPLIQEVLDKHTEAAATVDLGPALGREEIVHAIPLPGYTDRVPAVLAGGQLAGAGASAGKTHSQYQPDDRRSRRFYWGSGERDCDRAIQPSHQDAGAGGNGNRTWQLGRPRRNFRQRRNWQTGHGIQPDDGGVDGTA